MKLTLNINSISEIRTAVHKGHSVFINNANLTDGALESFVRLLGDPILEDRNINGQSIFNVKEERDDGYYTSYANSNHYFSLHTDCFSFHNPPNAVLLLCKTNSNVGGKSLLLSSDLLISSLSKNLLSYLQEKKWNISNVKRAILEINEAENKIFYNRTHIELSNKLSNSDLEKLNSLDLIADKLKTAFMLNSDQMIIFRNDKFLHGRTDFVSGSMRLLKRIRFSINDNR